MLQTDRLVLRPWAEEDIEAIHEIFVQPEVRRYLCDDRILPRERVEGLIESHRKSAELYAVGMWAVYRKSGERMIGFCGFFFTEGKQDLELMYGLLPENWGQGLATEAARAAVDYLWRATSFERVFIRTDPPNTRSIAVAERLGMQFHSSAPLLTYVLERPGSENGSKRARARELMTEHLAKGDPLGWFEAIYREAEEGRSLVPWADLRPNPELAGFWREHRIETAGKKALKIGCGLGDDAEQLARWGFETTAFDIAESAIRLCRRRFPDSAVTYVTADLLQPPPEWTGAFDFVLESYTLQVLPPALRERAMERAAAFVREGGLLLVITRGREWQESEGSMPWPLTRAEVERFEQFGLEKILFDDYLDGETPPVRRFRALFRKLHSP